ncbi:hypothetical protein [Actinoplanes sp. CA-252034]|uniref:hypothetical protein n=1 Tax=Actinoplanes sp. CA-252034 TaxID=3239906 RepID=UPI003D97D42E
MQTWPRQVGLLLGGIGTLLGANLLLSNLFGATGAETARGELLHVEAPQVIRELEATNLDPGNPGPASAAWLASRFESNGGTVIRSSSAPGRPASASLDVLLMRTAQGHALGQPTEPESVAICLRFETAELAAWGSVSDVRTTFHEIDCS